MQSVHTSSRKNILLISLFVLAIFVPFVVGIFEQSQIISDLEKRKLAKFPRLPKNIAEFGQLPTQIESYFSDHFGLRLALTHSHKRIKTFLHDSPSADVTIGQQGWLFLGSNTIGYSKYGDPIGDYRNINLYSDEQLRQITQYMNAQYLWLKQQGIAYVFFITPNKHSIYAEMLPNYINKVAPYSATDQLLHSLGTHTSIPVIDLRPTLLAAKHNKQLYYKGDTHWNHVAANIAQFQVMQSIEALFKGQITPELFEMLPSQTYFNGDLAQFIGAEKYDSFNPQPNLASTCDVNTTAINAAGSYITTRCTKAKLKTVIYGDSFFRNFLLAYFSTKFQQLTFLWRKPDILSLTEEIQKHHPDIVIEQWVERHLPYVPDDSAFTQLR